MRSPVVRNRNVLKRNSMLFAAALLAALDAVMSNRGAYNIRVVNMSLGSPAISSYKNDPLCQAVRKLANAGIVVVAAFAVVVLYLVFRSAPGETHSAAGAGSGYPHVAGDPKAGTAAPPVPTKSARWPSSVRMVLSRTRP